MELKILEERPNPLLKRTEYRFEVDHATAATPKREEIRVELAKAAKVPKDRVVVEAVHARFGTAKSEGVGAAYQSAEALKQIVPDHLLIRNGYLEKKAKAAPGAAAAEAPAAAPEKPAAPAKAEPAKGS